MSRTPYFFSAVGAALVLAGAAYAQPAPNDAAAEQRYQQQLAVCNSGTLAAPAREACVRNAGNALDRRTGGPPPNVEMVAPGGRATVISPAGAPVPSGGDRTTTSSDGRATIVPSTESVAPPR